MTDGRPDSKIPVMPKARRVATKTPTWVRVAVGMVVSAVVIWIAFLIFWILSRGSSIGTPAAPSSALVAANERLLQMVQWTIATILTLGGALIGLNWYQSERRYQDDKGAVDETLTEIQAFVGGLENRFHMLESAAVDSLVGLAMQEMKQEMRTLYSPMRPPVEAYIKGFQNLNENPLRRRAFLQLAFVEAANLKTSGELGKSDMHHLREVYEDVVAFDRNLGFQLAHLLIVEDQPNPTPS